MLRKKGLVELLLKILI